MKLSIFSVLLRYVLVLLLCSIVMHCRLSGIVDDTSVTLNTWPSLARSQNYSKH
jgi:hypothetical protein